MRTFARRLLLSLAALSAAVLAVVAHASLSEPVAPARDHRLDASTRVDDLALLLAAAGSSERIALARAFADLHRPAEGCAVLASRDGALVMAIGAHGTRSHADGFDASLAQVPSGCARVVLVAGNGRSVGLLGGGGRGGTCRVEGSDFLPMALVAGDGGEGIFGGGGGRGGGGGAAGPLSRPEPRAETYLLCGHGGRGFFGGSGGGW